MKTFGFDQAVRDGNARFVAAWDAAHIDFGFRRRLRVSDHRREVCVKHPMHTLNEGGCSRCILERTWRSQAVSETVPTVAPESPGVHVDAWRADPANKAAMAASRRRSSSRRIAELAELRAKAIAFDALMKGRAS